MITASRIEFFNWGRYRGEQAVDLTAGVYAVAARWHDGPQRSNWGGKSQFLELFPFAFYGWHRHRTEDEWITRGERLGWVRLTLDVEGQPVVIERRRLMGQSTKLSVLDGTAVDEAGEPRKLLGNEAQDFIIALLGLTERDFFATCFIGQKQMSRFVTEKPERRMDLVVEWLQMQALEQAHAAAQARLNEAVSALTRLEVEHATARTVVNDAGSLLKVQIETSTTFETMSGLIVEAIGEQEEAVAEAQGAVQALEQRREQLIAQSREYEDAREFARVAAEGKRLREKMEQANEPVLDQQLAQCRARLDDAMGGVRAAGDACTRLQKVAAGEFDGNCPVAPVRCPCAQQINGMRDENRAAYDAAHRAYEAARAQKETLQRSHDQTQAIVGSLNRDRATLDQLAQQAKRLRPAAVRVAQLGPQADVPPDDADMVEARADVVSQQVQLERLRNELVRVGQARAKMATLQQHIDATRAHVNLLTEAAHILGRTGAQREIARAMLAAIETSANEALEQCGVDLRVQVRWSYEGQGLARACEACGNPFPSSAKVKVCGRCGAERGQNTINRLDVVLSDRSGAAEDLAGIAIQMAACAWLRAERDSQLSLAILDEPFSSLDQQHKQALAAHLTVMLGRAYGVQQAFIVSHDASVAEALPCRVQIVAGPDGSAIEHVDSGQPMKPIVPPPAPVVPAVKQRKRRAKVVTP
jgi:DNA repair exonuclease SbcCD ATPase subunit